MKTIEVHVRRLSVISTRPFEEVVERVASTLGRPDMNTFHRGLAAARTDTDLEDLVRNAVGPSGLMEFVRFDAGAVLRKERGTRKPRILRLLVGNPLIMKDMARAVPDAASYAPVTILVDERADGVHLSYDLMASLLAPFGSKEVLATAKELDSKIESLIKTAAK